MPMTAREAIRLTKKMADASSGTERDMTFSRMRLAKSSLSPATPEIFRRESSEPSKKS